MQDSLHMMLNEAGDVEAAIFEWMGLNWWQLGLVILLIPLVIFLIYRFIVFISSEFNIRKERRRESEVNHFQLLGEMAKQEDPVRFYNQLLKWYDHFRSRQSDPGPGLAQFLASSGIIELVEGYEQLNKVLFGERKATGWSPERFHATLKRYRKSCLKKGEGSSKLKLPDINHSSHGRHFTN